MGGGKVPLEYYQGKTTDVSSKVLVCTKGHRRSLREHEGTGGGWENEN